MQVDHPQPHAWQRHLAGFGAASAALGSTSPTSPKPADQVSTSRSIFNLIKKTRGAQPSTGVSATGGSAGQSGSVGHVGNAAHSVGQYGDLTGRNGGSAVTHDLGPSTSARQQATWQRVPSPHHPPPQKSKQQAQHEPPPPRHHAADVSIDLAALRDRAVRSTASVVGFRQQHMVRFLRDANLLALKGRRACAMGGVWGAYEDVPVVWDGEGEAEAESSRGSTSAGGAAGAGSGEGRGGRDAERHSPRSHGSGEGSARIGGMAQGGCAGGGEGGKLHARFDEGASARERRREEDVSGEIIAAAGAADCDYNSAVRAAGLTVTGVDAAAATAASAATTAAPNAERGNLGRPGIVSYKAVEAAFNDYLVPAGSRVSRVAAKPGEQELRGETGRQEKGVERQNSGKKRGLSPLRLRLSLQSPRQGKEEQQQKQQPQNYHHYSNADQSLDRQSSSLNQDSHTSNSKPTSQQSHSQLSHSQQSHSHGPLSHPQRSYTSPVTSSDTSAAAAAAAAAMAAAAAAEAKAAAVSPGNVDSHSSRGHEPMTMTVSAAGDAAAAAGVVAATPSASPPLPQPRERRSPFPSSLPCLPPLAEREGEAAGAEGGDPRPWRKEVGGGENGGGETRCIITKAMSCKEREEAKQQQEQQGQQG
ncbi:unnamed protein product [Closterium sp. NIES-54]